MREVAFSRVYAARRALLEQLRQDGLGCAPWIALSWRRAADWWLSPTSTAGLRMEASVSARFRCRPACAC